MPAALAFAIELLTSLPPLISAGMDVVSIINNGNDALKKMKDENREPTDAEWSDQETMLADLRKQLPEA